MRTLFAAILLLGSFSSFAMANDLLVILDDQGILCNVLETKKECIKLAKEIVAEDATCDSKIYKMLNTQVVCSSETQAVADALNTYEELPCNTTSIDLEIAKRELSDCISIATNSCF